MKVEASTIDELIEKSGKHAVALRTLDELIVRVAPELERRRDCVRPVDGRPG